MFSKAFDKASAFTHPLVISTRTHDGRVKTDVASFIAINDSWAITAAHTFDSFVKYQADQNKIKEIDEINRNRADSMPASVLKHDPESITNHSFWWGWDDIRMTKAVVNRQMDIAAVQLDGLGNHVAAFPILADLERPRPGTSLLRLGYSCNNIQTEFDEAHKNFRLPPINHRDIIFPMETMHTRTIDQGKTKDDKYRMIYMETSTPGLGGQSGGPIVDVEGRVHAMQVRTVHIPTGFHPTVEYEGSTVIENQFLNLGVGLSIASIREFLDDNDVRYDAEGDESGYRITGRRPSPQPRRSPSDP